MPTPQPTGIFNVLDNGIKPGNGFAGANTTALKALVESLLDPTGPTYGNGGTILFPMIGVTGASASFQFNDTITIGPNPATIIFRGAMAGSGTNPPPPPPPHPVPVPVLLQTVAKDLFVIDNNPGASADIGGVIFVDLEIQFASGLTSGAAVHVQGFSQGVRLNRCALVDCPIGYWLDTSQSCTMIDCSVYNALNPGVALMLGVSGSSGTAIDTYIAGCIFLSYRQPQGTAVQVYGCEHFRMTNCRLEGYGQGIAITPLANSGQARYLYFLNVSCYPTNTTSTTGAAVLITTNGASDARYVFHVTFDGCDLSAPDGAKSAITSYAAGGVQIGPAFGPADAIDQIRFVDCHVCRWLGPGLEIVGPGVNVTNFPTNIEVLGGYYSLNGKNPGTGHQPAGISIIGSGTKGPSGIRITGAACNNSLFFPGNPPGFSSPTQKYGIYVAGVAQSIRVNACDFTGNLIYGAYIDGTNAAPVNLFMRQCDFTGLTSAVHVVTPVTNLQITDCPGYNDQNTPLNGGNPPTQAKSASICSTPYFGPSTISFSNVTPVTLNIGGVQMSVSAGSMPLPNPTDQLFFAATTVPSSFVWLGK